MFFRDIVGQQHIKQMLRRSVVSGRVSHAQLLSGATGNGTLALAIAYAQYLNCTNRSEEDSCGECPSCVKMQQLAHPDVNYIFPTASTKDATCDTYIAQFRRLTLSAGGYFDIADWYAALEIGNKQGIISRGDADQIIKKLSFKAFEAEYKIIILWLPEKMRVEASNALLKILEEPWEKTMFLLVSEQSEKLLPTILSRCQEISISGIDTADIAQWLVVQGEQQDKADVAARLSTGDAVRAKRIAQSEHEGAANENFELFVDLMRLSYNDKHMELIEWADSVAALGREEQKRFLVNALRLLRESYMVNCGLQQISYLWGAEAKFCANFAPFINNANIERLVSEIELTIVQVGQNGNPKIIFTHFALAVSKMIVRR